MTSTSKLTWCGVALALMVLLPGCSKETGSTSTSPDMAQAVPASSVPATGLKITSWGPQNTKAGVRFNAQPDGSAAFWVQVDQSLEGSDAAVDLDGKALSSAISGKLITADVPAELYAKPGTYMLHVTMKKGSTSTQSDDVKFVVE